MELNHSLFVKKTPKPFFFKKKNSKKSFLETKEKQKKQGKKARRLKKERGSKKIGNFPRPLADSTLYRV